MIAHRLSTVRNADKIVAFKDGKVAEEGTHETLLNFSDGVYANLVNMQAGREIDEEDDEKPDNSAITDDGIAGYSFMLSRFCIFANYSYCIANEMFRSEVPKCGLSSGTTI